MEPNLDNTITEQVSSFSPVTQKPKKNLLLRILKIIGITLGLYIVIGFVLILINPLFAFIVLYPVFIIQGFLGQQQEIALENELDNIQQSEIILPPLLTQSDCVGLIFTEDFRNLNNPRVAPYVDKLELGKFDSAGVCTTSKGNFVIKTSLSNGGDLAEIYKDENSELKKIVEIGESVFEFAEDDNGNVYLLLPKDTEQGVTRNALVYNEENKSFLKVADTADTVKVCSRKNASQCQEWKLKKLTIKAQANYDYSEQENAYINNNPIKIKTLAQLECIKEFNKEVDRSSGNLKNIKLPSDLSSEPLLSCVTDKNKRPFDFDLYLASGSNNQPYFAHFQTTGNDRVIAYSIEYGGFKVFNYALDSISHQIFENLISGEYKVGELMPQLDNNEANWAGFKPNSTLSSIDKMVYKNIDVYTIKSSTRFKAFLLGNTYILIRYDSNLDSAISEEDAAKIAQDIIDSRPYAPGSAISLQQPSSSHGSIDNNISVNSFNQNLTCTDSDGGINFDTYGKTEIREGEMVRGSEKDSCNGNFVSEVSCGTDQCSYGVVFNDSEQKIPQYMLHINPYDVSRNPNACTMTPVVKTGRSYNCALEGKVCRSGACVFE